MAEMQLEIDGIGQHKMTLCVWKQQNVVYTHRSDKGVPEPWSAWAHTSSPLDRLEEEGTDAFGYGTTEKEAILNLCAIENIPPPCWW